MTDYRKEYIEGKVFDAIKKLGQPEFVIESGKMLVRCLDGFEFEVVPVMARSLTHLNKDTNELTTITRSSVSVRQLRDKPAEQTSIPGVGSGE